jgi:hypothetical protein
VIRYLIRTPLGWDALDEGGQVVARYGGPLLYACQHFRVRRLMFGSYADPAGRRVEGWSVEPIPSSDPADT